MAVYDKLTDEKAVDNLRAGQVGVLPSDTIYGLMCVAANQQAVERLYRIKQRQHKPGTVIAASVDQLVALGIPRRYLTAVEQFWPGPVSVVVASAPELAYLDMGKMSLAVRIPDSGLLLTLLEQTGPLLTTSANMPGEPPANTIDEAKEYFGDTVDFYVDGGDLSGHERSTIICIVDDEVEVLREGEVKLDKNGRMQPG